MIPRRLLPAVVCAGAFVALDVSRLWLDGVPEVLAFCALPACWMALLPAEQSRFVVERGEHTADLGTVGRTGEDATDHELQQERGHHHLSLLPRLAPLAACLAYAAVLLALRHEPTVRAHWTGALQLPRLVAFGWALAVALRWRTKTKGPEINPEPLADSLLLTTYRSPLPPSTAIGIVMALGGGICAAGGLWIDWADVRTVAGVAWLLSAAIAWRAR